MKKIFLAIMAVMTVLLSQAHAEDVTGNADAMAATLKQDMKQLGSLFKQVGSTMNDASQNQANAANAGRMRLLFQAVLTMAPDTVADMPASERAQALQDYQHMIQQEIDLVTQLETAFLNNDNGTAVAVLQKMGDLKKQGHDKFKD